MSFMSEMAVNFIVTMVKSLMDNGLVTSIQELVKEGFSWTDIPGSEKRERVLEKLKQLSGVLGAAFAATAPWLINLAIEALVAKYKVAEEDEED